MAAASPTYLVGKNLSVTVRRDRLSLFDVVER